MKKKNIKRGKILVDIAGFEGLYAVTENGHIWAYPRSWKGRRGGGSHRGKWMVLNLVDGYHQIRLTKDGKRPSFKVCRLVASAFLPNPQGLPQVNHKNLVRNDDHVENLEWCTNAQNVQHATIHGRNNKRFGIRKLTAESVRQIRARYIKRRVGFRILAEQYGLGKTAIERVISRQHYKDI